MNDEQEDDVLRLLHTADWHLGMDYVGFDTQHRVTLRRARLEAVDRVLSAAERNQVDAVLCAGDLFDDPLPAQEWWEALAELLHKRGSAKRPVFLLPGNHDPLLPDSIWRSAKFRQALPPWAHVIDTDLFEHALGEGAVLYAVPCKSKAGQSDPTEKIPTRAPGDKRIRVGMVHGSTFDMEGVDTDFPIHRDAALKRGLDYLAIGDTHGFRYVPADRKVPPTIYPGAPEPTSFDEKDPGYAALVRFGRRGEATVYKERIARWTWEEHAIETMPELRQLAARDLSDRVLRLSVEMCLARAELDEADRILGELAGTPARSGKVGILMLDRSRLRVDVTSADDWSDTPEIIQKAALRLRELAADPATRDAAERALYHLHCTVRKAS